MIDVYHALDFDIPLSDFGLRKSKTSGEGRRPRSEVGAGYSKRLPREFPLLVELALRVSIKLIRSGYDFTYIDERSVIRKGIHCDVRPRSKLSTPKNTGIGEKLKVELLAFELLFLCRLF